MTGLTRAGGHPDFSISGTANFIPQLWAGKLVEKFYKATVFGEICNTDYEGQIKDMGDSVHIRTRPTIAIRNYTQGGGITYDKPTSASVLLNINKGKYFGFEINDVDAYQADINLMDEFSSDASEQMKIVIDADVLAGLSADIVADNKGATAGVYSNINLGATGAPVTLTKDNILDYIVDMGTVLDEQNVPSTGRWLVLPPWACGRIKKSDLRDASISGDGTSILRNGRIGMIDRFTLYNSNNLPVVVDGADQVTDIIAGHKAGLTFAAQMVKMETIKNPSDFGDLIRGLNTYGFKVIEGKYLTRLYAKQG